MAKWLNVSFAILCGLFMLSVITVTNGAAMVREKRSEGEQKQVCIGNTPCGWAIYTPFTRVVDYFMKNTCVCSPENICIRTDDDLSVSAYVYRCRDRTTTNPATSSTST